MAQRRNIMAYIFTYTYMHYYSKVWGHYLNVYEISILCSSRLQHLFDQKYSKNTNVVIYVLYF